ncbi:MAG: type I DNA topoisomerase [Gemmiger sp.]|uniref:type I DNA topoisomerase n=1 Tax=Gemmiger sp. TaxID=2049027 RepID=UPI002A821598|nr:type I DNA topoisomerase [Gemmiger sp.]MCI7192121.1 type I DNA topoisomerase [bacterium]MDY4880310.1 type I DNA topoisomerase [Gemmiger sp.]
MPKQTAESMAAAQKPAARKPAAKKAAPKGEGTAKKPAAKKTAARKPAAKKAAGGTRLVIVESPAKAKTIGKYLGRGYTVTASMGHIRDLPASTLGIDVENNYQPKYIIIKGKNALVKELKAEAKQAETVYLATDPDREGEAISWHLASVLGLDPAAPNRVTFDEITKKGIQEGMAHPRAIDMDLFNAQQARRELDRLVGYKLSPFLWHKVRKGLSAGRVQSVAVRIIRDRELEIEQFKPEEYWNIDASLKPRGSGAAFTARLSAGADGKKLTVRNKEEADAIVAALEGKPYTVTRVDKGQRRRQPQPPFITSTLQQDASRALGFSATRTMRAAQRLYEGMEVAGYGQIGLITYMRTDSLRIADEAAAAARTFISNNWGEPYVCAKKRVWKSRSATAAQDAHEAIRPSMPELTPEQVEGSISGDEARLYRLIWSRFMASQMADCVMDTVSATIAAGDYLFRASGYHVTFDGFTALYEESTDDKQKKATALPPLEPGQVLDLKKLSAEQKFTQPPPYYTEATLIHTLEENGIGRPSTYAPIITTIVDRGYVEKDQKKLRTTPLGQAVNQVMLEQFPDIVNPAFSADMEKKLDVVEAGKADWVQTVDEFYQGFAKSLEAAEKNMEGKRVKVEDIPTDEICDKCGRPMVIKSGRYGKFVACSGFPECRNSHPLVKDTGGLCPLCGGHMLLRKSAKGRIYYGCSNYPQCSYMTWDEPVTETCPNCGKTLFKRRGQLYCAGEGCGFVKNVEKKGNDGM